MLVFDAVLRHKGGILSLDSFRNAIGVRDAPGSPGDEGAVPAGASSLFQAVPRLPTLKESEEQLVAEALSRAKQNQGIAASLLGITRQALNKRLVRGAREGKDGGEPGG